MNPAQVRVPPAPGDVVGVAYPVSVFRAFPANLTSQSHSRTSLARPVSFRAFRSHPDPFACHSERSEEPPQLARNDREGAEMTRASSYVFIVPELPKLCPLLRSWEGLQ